MEFIKISTYVEQFNNLVRNECTGTTEEFAKKLGVSERTLQNHLQQLREIGFEIAFDYARKTYKYPLKGSIIFRFIPEAMNSIKGGTGFLD